MPVKMDSQYMCFADFEFTCGANVYRYGCEMLSVGVVICDSEYNIKEQFYCTSKPNRFPTLTKQCKKLTGLKQDEIDISPDSNDVLRAVVRLMKKYDVSSLYVWGNFDSPGLMSDIRQHKRKNKNSSNIKYVQSAIVDIQDGMTKEMELPQAVNIKELASAFSYKPPSGRFHNALNDAMALYTIHCVVHTTDFRHNEQFIALKQARIEKLESLKREMEQKRKEQALSIPLSESEKIYYEDICSRNDTKKINRFINLRLKFVSAFKKYSDEKNFVFLCFTDNGGVKIIPESKYKDSIKTNSVQRTDFSTDNFSEVLLKECIGNKAKYEKILL